jgi:transcriptional regulator with GAF, ATPase, and Fis domain
MSVKLVVLAGPLCGEAFPLDVERTTIGRDAASQLSIPDHLVSRRHCALDAANGRFILRDLGSANGTFVNGIPVGERNLEHGDRIRVGDSVLLFVHPVEDAASLGGEARRPADDTRTGRVLGDAGTAADRLSSPEVIAAEVLAGRVTLQAHEMVGDTPSMRSVYERIRKVAMADCTVLIAGETGTGKELAARAIHDNSPRARRPFVTVNCAALTESLLESELFGHEKGAFTGAAALKKGKMEVADGGTLFLDEIGELAPALQATFLRALQDHTFERVGGTRTIAVNVRVIAATNCDLAAAVASGTFREDLWYRLNVVAVKMPPLRDRRADIPRLATHLAAKHGRGRPLAFSTEALDALVAYDWPGNVRELENAVQRAIVLGCSDQIELSDLPDAVMETAAVATGKPGSPYHQSVRETKRRLILDAIDRSGGNCTAAAKLLGINPTYLHRLMTNLRLRETTGTRRD